MIDVLEQIYLPEYYEMLEEDEWSLLILATLWW
jgi:hypothetical protein